MLAQVYGCLCAVSNRTIDDFYGDEITGSHPIYEPLNAWNTDGNCTGCFAKADPSMTFQRSWHDSVSASLPPSSVEIHFTGSTIYLFCVVTNTVPDTNTLTNLTFSLDGTLLPGGYTRIPDNSSDILYNVSVLAAQGLTNASHILVARTASQSLFLFDYAIYT
ncbi:hypothetical protein FB451DRAFT_1043042 [Mycena latifolia]|nr:hypothetical protein FB451DRAFT_1043042 [Mycena latifolia]